MTWSYNTSLAEKKDQVRFYVRDIDSTEQLAQDEEINLVLSSEGNNVFAAAATICDSIAMAFNRQVSLTDSTIKDDNKDRAAKYMELAETYRKKALSGGKLSLFAGGVSVSDKGIREMDSDRVGGAFAVGLHETSGQMDAPEAGEDV
jgi:hypothetical protein